MGGIQNGVHMNINGEDRYIMAGVIVVAIVCVILAAACIGALVVLAEKTKKMERYRLIEEQCQVIWIDYHFHPAEMAIEGDIENYCDREDSRAVLRGAEIYDIYNWVHPDDLWVRSDIRQLLESEQRYYKGNFRLRRADGGYVWYTMLATLCKDKRGKNDRMVIRLENADAKLSQEQNLLAKAENDLLTGIFNKKTMEEKITALLAEYSNNKHYIFFMIDLDNFKGVNDTLGHIYGDKVLTDTAAKLRKVFPAHALIGRLGGDEFAVCAVFEAFDEENLEEYIEKKAEQLRGQLRESYYCDDLGVDVSASIGIACAPRDGVDFETIYRKADKALYLSKRSGKDRYNIFRKSDANE